MSTIIFSLLSVLQKSFQTRVALQAENLALRHQLLVLQRSRRSHASVWDVLIDCYGFGFRVSGAVGGLYW
jgi:hypothetical protein